MRKKIVFASSGLGHTKRGLEIFTQALFRKLQSENFETYLIKGGGQKRANEFTVSHFARHQRLTNILAKLIKRHPFYIQNISFSIAIIPLLLRIKPDVIYTGEPIVYRCLARLRSWTNQNYRIIFFTGGQTIPQPFGEKDVLHHVTPLLKEKAATLGIAKQDQFLIPHFYLHDRPSTQAENKKSLRLKLGLPPTAKILLSVGAIDQSVKRMKYVISEVSQLSPAEYFLLMLGEKEAETAEVIDYANLKLPTKNFRIDNVPSEQIMEFYKASDIFILASLKEGFGLVYLEALAAGLPIITHPHEAANFVVADHATYGDLSQPGALKEIILSLPDDNAEAAETRKKFLQNNFSWEVLQKQYLKMFDYSLSD